jgi:integrase
VSVYKRGDVWWYKFHFAGQEIRESSKSESKMIAKEAERARRRQLEESFNSIKPRKVSPSFSVASTSWLNTRTSIAPATERSYKLAISQLVKNFGKQLLSDISAEDLAQYQMRRKRERLSNRTVNLELGVMRSILRRHRMWEALSLDVKFLKENPSPGRAITSEEESRLLDAASKSRCRSLYPVIMLAINTGMRSNEIRALTWQQVDFLAGNLTVGKSKTAAGSGRVIPLTPRAFAVLTQWRSVFPGAEPTHYVFPHEKYGLATNDRNHCAYNTIPTEQTHRWKVAWETVRKVANVSCRFHDLRHTFISRLAESQTSDSTVMALAGHVSRAMMERYSHVRNEAKRKAVENLSGVEFNSGWAQNRAQFFVSERSNDANSVKTSGEPGRTRTSNPLIKRSLARFFLTPSINTSSASLLSY